MKTNTILSEWDIYGSAAHGKFAIRQPKEVLVYSPTEDSRNNIFDGGFYRIVGEKQYHLTDHLACPDLSGGIVRATVSDIKEPSGGGFLTNTITAASFYPFVERSEIPTAFQFHKTIGRFMEEGRFFGSSNRWGFNGMEKDDKIKGAGNSLSFGDYGYDPRKAMRQNIEPLIGKYPGFSSYLAFGDNPIVFADPMGLDATHYTLKKNEDGSFEKIEGETVDELNGQELEGNYSIYHYNGNTYTFSDRNPEDDNLWIWSWNIEKEDDFASNPDAAIEIGVKPDQYYYDKFDFWKRVGEVSGLDDPIRLAIDGYFMGKVGKASVGAFKPKISNRLHGSGPVAGTIEISNNVKSIKAFLNYKPKNPIEFIYDPLTKRFIVGKPNKNLTGSPHQQLVKSGDIIEHSKIVGGTFSRDPQNGNIVISENSGHYGMNWTDDIRKEFIDFLEKKTGLKVKHEKW